MALERVVPRRRGRVHLESDGLERETNRVFVEDRGEAGLVIGMAVRQRHDVETRGSGPQRAGERAQRTRRVGTGVDEHGHALRIEEERVTLADVECDDPF